MDHPHPPAPRRPRAVLSASPAHLVDLLFPGELRAELEERVELLAVVDSFATDEAREALARAEVLLTGWGTAHLDAPGLAAAPQLRAVLHAGGSALAAVDADAARERGLLLSNAGLANSVPVAEYTLAMILLAGTGAQRGERLYRQTRAAVDREESLVGYGNLRRTVGIVGASRIGRMVVELLRPFALTVVVADPTLDDAEAADLGVELVSLAELARRSHVVSLHVPVLPSTVGMVDAAFLAALPDGATLINTARGVVVDQEALVAELRTGRIDAVLDVTEPDPLPADHPLFDLPNVVLTPHVAGALGTEISRMGRVLLDEVARLARGEELAHLERA